MPSSKTAIFLDFDHTLFNSDHFFRFDVRNAFLHFGVDEKLWQESYDNVWPSGYSLEKHIKEASRLSGKDLPLEEMNKILQESFSDLAKYLYPDVTSFLKHAQENGITLYLLSFGDPTWQEYKVSSSGIKQFFDKIFYTSGENKKSELVSEYAHKFDRVIVVDNNPLELDLIKQKSPNIETYRINRVPDNMLEPKNEEEKLKFQEARKYANMVEAKNHILCKSLNDIVSI